MEDKVFLGITGFKCGMSRLFTKEGRVYPVTLVHIPRNIVTQVKTKSKEGYDAVQLGCKIREPKHLTRAQQGHLKASNYITTYLKEYPGCTSRNVGSSYSVQDLSDIKWVDIQATSKGKGFAGVVRRWGFKTQPASHGNSKAHRAHGSTGGCQDPGRVIKGKKMAGHLGAKTVTFQNLQLLKVDPEAEIIVIKGGIPGPKGAAVRIRPAIKKRIKS